VIPWPVLCLATVAIVVPSSIALTSVLARTPLAVPLTGRTRVPWRRPRCFPPHPAVLGDQDGVDAVEPLGPERRRIRCRRGAGLTTD
jgi:hypothetical protein